MSLRVNERGTEFERALLLSNVPFECISFDFKWWPEIESIRFDFCGSMWNFCPRKIYVKTTNSSFKNSSSN